MIKIFVLNIVAFMFMLGVSFSAGIFSAYLKSFGATEFIISLGAAALYITRGSASILIDRISTKISFKKLFIISFVGSAISSILFLLPNDPFFISILRTIQGVFSGIYWVLINIYAISLGSNGSGKFKNLTTVTMFINIGGFLGCIISGKIAEVFSADLSFYIGAIILTLGSFICLFLKDIQNKQTNEEASHKNTTHLQKREKLIILFAIMSSAVYAYIGIGIPLFILQLGGSYKEIGITSGLGIGAGVIILAVAPLLRKHFSYSTIIRADYILIIINLFAIFYFKSIFLIYILQSILIGIVALERNLWYSILHDHSNNYNRSIGILRGYMDYFGMILFLLYGYAIQKFDSLIVAMFAGVITFIFLILLSTIHQLKFLKRSKAVHIHGICQYNHILHANGIVYPHQQ